MRRLRTITKVRLVVFCFTLLLSLGIFVWVITTIPEQRLQIIRLTQLYALTAVTYLYFTLLPSPLLRVFPKLPYGGMYIHARRALGVSTFYFALLHASIAFFVQLGGFPGLPFLNNKYLLAVTLSASALLILFVMASISWDGAIRKIGFSRWKLIHRFVYLAAILILVHALMLGSHFTDLSSAIPQIFFLAVSVLAFLEALRFDTYLKKSLNISLRFGITTLLIASGIIIFQVLQFIPADLPSLSIHEQHLQIAKQLNQQTLSQSKQSFPGLQGDPTTRYTVDIESPDAIDPGHEVTIQFRIFDSQNGKPVTFFQKNYERLMHLVIVGEDFMDFSHIHPTLEENVFTVSTTFPRDGTYHLYLSYQPVGSIEQHAAFTIPVGTGKSLPVTRGDPKTTKAVGGYTVSLSYPKPLLAQKLTLGEQTITFMIKNAKTGKPVTNLRPYLGAFGHLVMIQENSYDYLHVHPVAARAPLPKDTGGPEIRFVPLGLTAPIKSGTYRLFAQFDPDGKVITAEFIVKVE